MSSWGNRRKIAGIDNNSQYDANIDQFGNLRVRNLIWDTGLLAWIAQTAGEGGGGGGDVSVLNWPEVYPVSGTVTAEVSFPATQQTQEQALAVLIDEASATITYIGEALPGSDQGAAAWRIKKIDTSSGVVITWADGNASFDNVWTGHAGLSYS